MKTIHPISARDFRLVSLLFGLLLVLFVIRCSGSRAVYRFSRLSIFRRLRRVNEFTSLANISTFCAIATVCLLVVPPLGLSLLLHGAVYHEW